MSNEDQKASTGFINSETTFGLGQLQRKVGMKGRRPSRGTQLEKVEVRMKNGFQTFACGV